MDNQQSCKLYQQILSQDTEHRHTDNKILYTDSYQMFDQRLKCCVTKLQNYTNGKIIVTFNDNKFLFILYN